MSGSGQELQGHPPPAFLELLRLASNQKGPLGPASGPGASRPRACAHGQPLAAVTLGADAPVT